MATKFKVKAKKKVILDSTTRLDMRIPVQLKKWAMAAAAKEELSLSAWLLKLIEDAL